QGLEVETILRPEEAPDAIIAEAACRPAGLIVMATHGRGGLGRRLLRSIAAVVLARPPAPVLLVPPGPLRARWPAPGAPPRLLAPLDGSAFAEAALPLAGGVAAALGGD